MLIFNKKINKLSKKIDKLAKKIEAKTISEYVDLKMSTKTLIWKNFVSRTIKRNWNSNRIYSTWSNSNLYFKKSSNA